MILVIVVRGYDQQTKLPGQADNVQIGVIIGMAGGEPPGDGRIVIFVVVAVRQK